MTKNLLARTTSSDLAKITFEAPSPDRDPARVFLFSKTKPASRATYRRCLDQIATMVVPGSDALTFPWAVLRYQHTVGILAALEERYSPSTVGQRLAALKGVLRECWRLGYTTAEEYQRAVDLIPARGTRLLSGRALSMGEVRQLFENCAQEGGTAAYLDAAIIAVLVGAGLRRAELVELQVDDYDPGAGELVVRGKGGKHRQVPVGGSVRGPLDAWLSVRGSGPGPILCPVGRTGDIDVGKGVSTQAIYARLQRRGRKAGVKAFSPHDLRRTHTSELLDAGADVLAVANLLGHANVQTTRRYDRRGERAKRKATDLLHLPWTAFSM